MKAGKLWKLSHFLTCTVCRSRGHRTACPPVPPLLDSDEAADLLRIHPKTLPKMAQNGRIHGIQVGRLWRFRASDLELWLKTKRAG
ncbi:MAG: hypothetical protein DMG70_05560 [Acidobacteria bacterium]|nr:MAG: hypothetical protein DMG70_05560 [Acidobacteriota bacterium]